MIKNLFLMLTLASIGGSLFAQDQIVKTNGEQIMGKVIRVNTLDIIYKKKENPDGMEYSELKANILFIKYENGQKDNFATANLPVKAKMTSSIGESLKRKNSVFLELGGNGLYASVNYERKIFNSRNNNFGTVKLGVGPFATLIVLNATTTYNIGDGMNFFEFGGGAGVRTRNLFNGYNYSDRYNNFFYFTPTLGYRRQSDKGFLFRLYISTFVEVDTEDYYLRDLNGEFLMQGIKFSYDYYPFLGVSCGYSF